VEARLDGVAGLEARLARELVRRCRVLTSHVDELEDEIKALVIPLAPSLLANLRLWGPLSGQDRRRDGWGSALPVQGHLPATTAPHLYQSGRRTPFATASTEPAIGSSTPLSTKSLSSRPVMTRAPARTSIAGEPAATQVPKRCAVSNAASRPEALVA
jgi:hypothetical protein